MKPDIDGAEEHVTLETDGVVPASGYRAQPVVGLGGSAGGIEALRAFFEAMPRGSGLAFAVVMHLSPDHESLLPQVLQRSTRMKVVQVTGTLKIEPETVYVIPPRGSLRMREGTISVDTGGEQPRRGRNAAVDIFFRTLADTLGPNSAAVVLSGADGDGAIGIKRMKERGGLTVAQDPAEAEHENMPRAAIATGMVDWVMAAGAMPQRILEYFELAARIQLPAEGGPQPAEPAREPPGVDEASLREVLTFLRTRTGRDFSSYKRATIARRVSRRMQVNGTHNLGDYLACLRQRPGESGALLQDLLISVTNFFRDADCFAALDAQIHAILSGKGPDDIVRVWVVACATGEEAYSVAMLLADRARAMEAPPVIQVFATDLDDHAVQVARDGIYPVAIEADVDEERLKRYFVREHRGYRVRRELREMVLFAMHDVLKDSPFSRLDLVSCRNLMIYLNRQAQARLLGTFHFALVPGGRLFLGSSESVEDGSALFSPLDKKHRLFQHRPTYRGGIPIPNGPGTVGLAIEALNAARDGMPAANSASRPLPGTLVAAPSQRQASWADLHLKMLEVMAPPSILVDRGHEVVHLSGTAGRFLHITGGEPTRNLLSCIHPSLRIELRAVLYQAAQTLRMAEVSGVVANIGGDPVSMTLRVLPAREMGEDMYLVVLLAVPPEAEGGPAGQALPRAPDDAVSQHLDRELERLKMHLHGTVEQYEASNEELKASNEELQAMNEELRSASEELETSREELQSINEELTTVNHELKDKVDELGHANSDMHNLMDATSIATVFLDRELRITRYTPASVSLFSLIPTDLGRPLTDLKTLLQYPDLGSDAARVLGHLVPIEREVGQPDGSWYLARLLPYRTIDDRIAGVVLSFINITERKNAEEMRLWLSAVVTATSDAIVSFALDGTILSWNNGAERIFGYKAAEAIGKDLSMLAPPDGPDPDGLVHRVSIAETIEIFETVRRRKDGSDLHVSITVSPIRDDTGRVMAGTAMFRDISELLRVLADNEKARADLQAADEAKDRYLAVLSHELRNPLASIDSASALMLDSGAGAGDARRAAEIVQRQVRSMKVLLDDLLDVSRLKLGRLELKFQRVRLSAVIASALETTRTLLTDAGHSLTVDLPSRDVELPGDALRLGQVLANLLTNAIRYTPRPGKIIVKGRLQGDRLELLVKDTGVGMDPARIDSMFEMFTQGDTSGAHTQGLGIGLALVKSIVELHGGEVSAKSAGLGNGSEFHVVLPGASSLGNTVPAAAPAPASTPGPVPKGTRGLVLVADDNADAGWGMARLLELAGFQTVLVRGGHEALAAMQEHAPDAAIIDIGMPDLDGHQVARRARAAAWGRTMVLVAATGWGQQSDELQAQQAGFDAHMTKPVDLKKLSALLDELLVRKRG